MSASSILEKSKQFEVARKQGLANIEQAAKEVVQELSELNVKYIMREGTSPDDKVEIYFFMEQESNKSYGLGITYINVLTKMPVAKLKSKFFDTIEGRIQSWIKNGSDI